MGEGIPPKPTSIVCNGALAYWHIRDCWLPFIMPPAFGRASTHVGFFPSARLLPCSKWLLPQRLASAMFSVGLALALAHYAKQGFAQAFLPVSRWVCAGVSTHFSLRFPQGFCPISVRFCTGICFVCDCWLSYTALQSFTPSTHISPSLSVVVMHSSSTFCPSTHSLPRLNRLLFCTAIQPFAGVHVHRPCGPLAGCHRQISGGCGFGAGRN